MALRQKPKKHKRTVGEWDSFWNSNYEDADESCEQDGGCMI
jgi:hypothetical protein